ncbi:phytanoyl-CoA dioxygenase family protein [Paenibacillus oleatilyticus]|uniref:phytanoyl-CoA dioxygenase family protein n=1 Tax=Paenibacillus oleatilyticus TaxID=2594886 RepID=UPI001C1F7B79|nr:phytanoyl-CoA dioxygenase family protein [Paenibacillus oleatilyticus]MBU7317615.1 phytanoyl-CoA dioxygenase family protein [Paenibacillus oleatilyticus]
MKKLFNLGEYNKQGYLHLKKFFPVEEIEKIRTEAKNIFIQQMINKKIISSVDINEIEFEKAMFEFFQNDLQVFMNCGKQAQHLISLHRLSLDDRLVSVLHTLGLESPVISTRPVLFFNSRHLAKKEVYWKVFAHQDWRSMQGSLDSIVVWIPLMDIDFKLGALEIVPESHMKGLLKNEIVDSFGKIEDNEVQKLDFVSIPVSQGDVVIFSAFLVHRSGNNVSEAIRWSCHFRYNNLCEATFIQRGYPHPYLYKPQEDLITAGFPKLEHLQGIFKK